MCKDPVEEMAAPLEGPVDFLEKERQLIAYELHENVHKTLALLRLYIRLLKPAAEDELEIKSRSLEELDLVMTEINCLSRELATPASAVSPASPASPASSVSPASPTAPKIPIKGLVESLRDLIAFIRLSKGIAIEFDNDLETYPIDVGKKLAIFRVIQAQLENILELPTSTAANIILTLVDQHVQLIIQDNDAGSFAGFADANGLAGRNDCRADGQSGRKDGSAAGETSRNEHASAEGQTAQDDRTAAGQAGRIGQRMSYIRERVRIYQGKFELETGKDGGRKLTVTIPVRTLPGRLSCRPGDR